MQTKTDPVFDYIFGLTVPGVKLELGRVKQFIENIGNPYQAYSVIHIAGTNGKGSTSAMIASIINAYGVKTGLFTSPHLVKPNERIRIGEIFIPNEFIVNRINAWRQQIEELGLTFFEVLTALGMDYFRQETVEYAVFETGLGGRLDATNVVDPLACIITAISMDHENILGDTLKQIATEKAGIIKAGKPVFLAKNNQEVREVMEQKCMEVGTHLYYVPDFANILSVHVAGTKQNIRIEFDGDVLEFSLPLLGHHQVENFCNVLVTLDGLGFELNSSVIQLGLDQMSWPGRIQTLQSSPLVLYDVAHNPAGLERLVESLILSSHSKATIIAAFNARKNIKAMLDILASWRGQVLFAVFAGHSSIEKQVLMAMGVSNELIYSSLEGAYSRALEIDQGKEAICFFGSHYIAESLNDMFKSEK
ncbi:MAG: bifunctional folylpolyglutamate synthase/dihydrofolate synthase [Candidatus Marinimicrobia bacterium]|nr:bifunctional folylpolyglutamate synthase/dihydrofolate synthase [Candidatus Neomarinimicrobiota bacterium]